MKGFNKLVLAAAIAAASSATFAMQQMDDDSMSTATGQDGITINMNVELEGLDVKYIDRDGIQGNVTTLNPDYLTDNTQPLTVTGPSTYNNAGAIHISPFGIKVDGQTITIDAGGTTADASGDGQLRIGLAANTTTLILNDNANHDGTGNGTKITVANANNNPAGTTLAGVNDDTYYKTGTVADRSAIGTNESTILQFNTDSQLVVSGGVTEILLGSRAQGVSSHFITTSGNIAGITLTGLNLVDDPDEGMLSIGRITLANLNLATGIDFCGGGNQYGACNLAGTAGTAGKTVNDANGLGIVVSTQGTVGSIALERVAMSATDKGVADINAANVAINAANTATNTANGNNDLPTNLPTSLTSATLAAAAPIGDVYISGAGANGLIYMNNTIVVRGH